VPKAKIIRKPTLHVGKKFCFVCGADNSQGMRLKFSVDSKPSIVRGVFHLAHRYMGPSSFAHRGIIAAIMDEAMVKLDSLHGAPALTAEIIVKYLRPVPLGHKIIVEARPLKQRGKHYWRECTIRDARGRLLVHGKGEFGRAAR